MNWGIVGHKFSIVCEQYNVCYHSMFKVYILMLMVLFSGIPSCYEIATKP